jgi:hypothetical protein
MQAARDGERSHHRDDRRADIGFHEFKEVLDRSAHRKCLWAIFAKLEA